MTEKTIIRPPDIHADPKSRSAVVVYVACIRHKTPAELMRCTKDRSVLLVDTRIGSLGDGSAWLGSKLRMLFGRYGYMPIQEFSERANRLEFTIGLRFLERHLERHGFAETVLLLGDAPLSEGHALELSRRFREQRYEVRTFDWDPKQKVDAFDAFFEGGQDD